MGEKVKLDDYETRIIKELIRNPRISDNKIAKKTNIPLKTVNRKRKKLEKNGLIKYMTFVDNTQTGTGSFESERLYIIKFKLGISRKLFLDVFNSRLPYLRFNNKHITYSRIGEVEGHLALILNVASRIDSDMIEILNVDIIGQLTDTFGQDCVENIELVKLDQLLRLHHNYLFGEEANNMKNGIIKDEYGDDGIFVN